jgi:Family of unknown function (DUF5715)
MSKGKASRYVLLVVVSAAAGVAVWATLRFTMPRRALFGQLSTNTSRSGGEINSQQWAQAVARAKEDRVDPANANVALDVPSELRHYEDRHWFLATQVAEVKKHSIRNCQDFLDVAAMISRSELVNVPGVTDDYVLLGVGARADDKAFTRYEDDKNIDLYDEAQLRAEYQQLSDARSKAQNEIARLNSEASSTKSRDRIRRRELQKQVSTQQQQLKSIDEQKALLDQSYGQPDKREELFSDYQSLQTLAKNFRGRAYDLANPNDRQSLKIAMLSSLRPAALKILEEVGASYHRQFDRPLLISSLLRPEEYQHALRRFNRAAVLIDTPPHSTGLAFDIDYRYMSAAEQNFVMNELARLKREGRIEVLRERGANFHVFAFIDGTRPSDQLITASLEDASPSLKEANHANEKPAAAKKAQTKKKPAKPAHQKPRARKRR